MILLRTLNSWSWAQRAFSPTELIEIYKNQGGNSRRREQGVWGQRRGAARGHSCPLPLHWCGELRAQESHGFTVTPQRFGGYPVVALTDLDYEEDICLISDHVEQVQELLIRVEAKCSGVSLRLNAKKTEVISFNIPRAIHLSEQQEAMLWKTSATSSGVPWSILRNGTLRWERQRHGGPFTTGKRLEIQSSSTHLNHSLPSHCQICALLWLWVMDPEAHSTEIFGCMLHMSAAYSTEQWPESANSQWAPCMVGYRGWVTKVASRRRKVLGHCHWHQELPASKLVLWELSHIHQLRRRPMPTYVDISRKDTGVESSADLERCVEDGRGWTLQWNTWQWTT